MKQAIAYIRISDKDQSNFSLAGQEKYIRDHCMKNNIVLSAVFTDDGKSAKNFDRPDWKKLEQFIQQHHKNVDNLIVVKYDRFSRNAAEGLRKIEMLEQKFRITIISVFEQMFIDYDSPFFFKQRADMLVNAEFELHVIRDRTRFGMHHALTSGRYVSKAPIGYKNTRDEHNKPLIVVDETKAHVIRKIFQQYMNDVPLKTIYREAIANGLRLNGNSAIPRIIENCVYAGLVFAPAYRKEPERFVKGLHIGLIDESIWWSAKQKLHRHKHPKQLLNAEVPLRGVVRCYCGKLLTAGKSKGKKNYYWYYKCNDHAELNFSANKLHLQFDDVLKYFSFTSVQLNYLYVKAEKEMHTQLSDRKKELQQKSSEWKTAQAQIDSLEEKFISNQINAETYNKWHNTYKHKESSLRFAVEQLSGSQDKTWKLFKENLPKLSDVHFLYQSASLVQKQTFIKLVFNSQLRYESGSYRTPYLLKLFSHNALILKEKGLLIVEQSLEKEAKFR
jgi:site-specific DNA recombinase